MSRPGRNARQKRALAKREPMPLVGLAWTRTQAKEAGIPVLPIKESRYRRLKARPVGDRRHEDRRKAG